MPSPNIDESIYGAMSYSNQFGSGSLGNSVIYHKDRTTVSVKTPHYREMKRRFLLPINPYHFHWDNWSDPKVVLTASSRDASGVDPTVTNWAFNTNVKNFGGLTGHTEETTADDPSQKAINKIIEGISLAKASSAVAAAEFSKTAAMVAQNATKIYRALKALKSGNILECSNVLGITSTSQEMRRRYTGMRKATYKDWKLSQDASGALVATPGKSQETFKYKRSFDTFSRRPDSHVSDFIADTWLEFSYGWKPLLQDVHAHAAAAAEIMVGTNQGWQKYVGRSSSDKASLFDFVPDGNQVRHTFKGRSQIWVEISVIYRIPPGALDIQTAFGLQNPLEVAWELVPFSFVVDWFYPIGEAIRALSAFNGLVFGSGYKSHKHVRELTSTTNWKHPANLGGQLWFGGQGTAKLERYEYDQGRVILSTFPVYGAPKLKDPRSFAHAASAIALLQSLFLRKK